MSDNILTAELLAATCKSKEEVETVTACFERLDYAATNILNKLLALQAQEATNAR